MRGVGWLWLVLLIQLGWSDLHLAHAAADDSNSRPLRVALLDFSAQGNSFREQQVAAEFTDLLRISLASEPGWDWVERAQSKRVLAELNLAVLNARNLRAGKWLKADLLMLGTFSSDDRGKRTLSLEAIDLLHADLVAEKKIVFTNAASRSLNEMFSEAETIAAAAKQLLLESKAHLRLVESKPAVAPLFFSVRERQAGAPPQSRLYDNRAISDPALALLEPEFVSALQSLSTNSGLRVIRFPRASRAEGESDLILSGLVEADLNAWQKFADVYVWGLCEKNAL